MAARSQSFRHRAASERGAIMIQVGVAILVLSAFAMFVVDYGVLWVSRHQAQNAADAGALAGAAALALDDFDDRSDTGPAKLSARSFARANMVFGEQPDVQMATDVRFYEDAPAEFPASCNNDDCIRVDVYRNQARGNALPMFFGWLVGVNDQGVRATATAQAAAGNASACLKPWAVLDKWAESMGAWTTASQFDPVVPPADNYTAPTENGVGTSYTLNDHLGLQMTLKIGDPHNLMETFGAGWFSPVELECPRQGLDTCYEEAISGCAGTIYTIGDNLPVKDGNVHDVTRDSVLDLIALDAEATWDDESNSVSGSCVGPPYTCATKGYQHSPRLVALPVVNSRMAFDAVHAGGGGNMTMRIVTILGFFVESVSATGDVTGYLATKPDLKVSNGGGVNPAAAFLKTVQLVR